MDVGLAGEVGTCREGLGDGEARLIEVQPRRLSGAAHGHRSRRRSGGRGYEMG